MKYEILKHRQIIRPDDEVLCGQMLPAKRTWLRYGDLPYSKDLKYKVGVGDMWQVGDVRRPIKILINSKGEPDCKFFGYLRESDDPSDPKADYMEKGNCSNPKAIPPTPFYDGEGELTDEDDVGDGFCPSPQYCEKCVYYEKKKPCLKPLKVRYKG
jgi:hypothetical protein